MKDAVAHQTDRSGSPVLYLVLLTIGVVLIFMGVASLGGSMLADHLSGKKLPNGMDCFVVPIVFGLLPSILIARSLTHLHSRIRFHGLAVVAVTFLFFIGSLASTAMVTYNYFVQAEMAIDQALTNVENAYQKRFNVIKNLNAASKRYQEHERSTIKDIVDARKAAVDAKVSADKIQALDKFDATVKSLFVNIEAYPNLKADQLVLELMKNITSTENDLLKEKTEYNNRVIEFNKSIRLLPYMLVARLSGFQQKTLIHRENDTDIYNARSLLKD